MALDERLLTSARNIMQMMSEDKQLYYSDDGQEAMAILIKTAEGRFAIEEAISIMSTFVDTLNQYMERNTESPG